MILVLENMDIQDIVLFNYGDTINGTSLHSTRIPFTLDFSRSGFITILSLFFEPVRGTRFTGIFDILGSVTWTAAPIRIFRLDILVNRGYGSVQSFQRGSFR